MNIPWWERDELVEHFMQRPDIWTPGSTNSAALWVRSLEDLTGACAVVFTPPATSGPFRQYDVRTVPQAWTEEECEDYLTGLLNHWTSYGYRNKVQAFLIDSLHIAPEQASLAAIVLGRMETDESLDPDKRDMTYQPALEIMDSVDDEPPAYTTPDKITYSVAGGGWLHLEPREGSFRITISLRDHSNYGGGYGLPMIGHVRPSDGHVNKHAALLSGAQLFERPDPHGTEEQAPLPLFGDEEDQT
jgi:hypothetical protein